MLVKTFNVETINVVLDAMVSFLGLKIVLILFKQ